MVHYFKIELAVLPTKILFVPFQTLSVIRVELLEPSKALQIVLLQRPSVYLFRQ